MVSIVTALTGFWGGKQIPPVFAGFIILFSLLTFPNSYSQSKPVTVVTTLTPPYTPFLSEYSTDITDKLRVIVILHDSRISSYPVKLRMSLELAGTGEVMRTPGHANTPVVYLDGGTTIFNGTDLSFFFSPVNMEFSGSMGQMYVSTGRIPDGLYRIGFSVVDAMRPDVILATTGFSAPSWFVLNAPPLPMIPGDYEEVEQTGIQNVHFSWTPRHLASGNRAFSPEYTFNLHEMRITGMGKDRTALSTSPVYTTTTPSTSIFLTADDYILEQGVTYVWFVEAKSGTGVFTLFENEGRSETRAFTYGCLCPIPGPPLPYSVSAEKISIGWTADPMHMEYETRFRKKNDYNGIWHTRRSYLGETVIDKVITPLTPYEFQVRAKCFNGEWSDYSPVNWVTTGNLPHTTLDCGTSDEMLSISNHNPKSMLYAGEVINYGNWKIVLTEVFGSNGIFSGKGTIRVPLLNNANVRMVFSSIEINELNQVTAGVIRTESNENSRLIVDDITDYFNEGDQTGNIIDNTAVTEITLDFAVEDDISVTISPDETAVIISSGLHNQSFTVNDPGEGTTIIDSEGKIYSISGNGTATLIGKNLAANPGEEYPIYKSTAYSDQGTRTGETVSPGNSSPYSAILNFEATGRWAMDEHEESYSGSTIDAEYTTYNNTYVPWKMVPYGKSDKLRITVNIEDIDSDKIKFITAGGTEFFSEYDGINYDIEILSGREHDGYELFIVYEGTDKTSDETTINGSSGEMNDQPSVTTQGNQILGKINIASYPLIKRSVTIVPIKDANVDRQALKNALDEIYNKYGVTWDVTVDDPFTDISWDTNNDGLASGGSGFFSVYTDEMRALNNAYAAEHCLEENTVYLFWFNATAGDNSGLAGDMPLDSPFGYIFAPTAGATVYNTVAHELGHGTFQLRHTFSDNYGIPRQTTDNLMDYSGGTILKKYQWDLLHDPRTMIAGWAQGEEEIAMMSPQDLCWEKGRENWDQNKPDKYLASYKLEYDASCTFMYGPNLHRSYFSLTDGNILIVDEVENNDSKNAGEKNLNFLYHLYIASENEWYEIDMDTFLDDCFNCKVNDIATKAILLTGKTAGRYILPIEDLFIMITGNDFDGIETSTAIATTFLLIEFIPGSKLVKPVTKGFKAAIKTTVKGARKIFRIVDGVKIIIGEFADDILKPTKWIDGEVDEVLETLRDINYASVEGKAANGTIQIVKKGDKIGFRLAKFTTIQIDQFSIAATKNPESKKVIFGKYISNSTLSYNIIAGKEYTYFNLDDWENVSNLVNGVDDEMWKINKKFIDNQIRAGKEIYFSHDPWKEIEEVDYSFFLREIEYLMDKGCKNFEQIGENLWKAIW